MFPNSIGAEVKADVNLAPKGSQIFVFSSLLLSAFSLIVGFVFLWYKHEYSWVPFLFTFLLGLLSSVAWFKSYKNVDLGGAPPTTISATPSGIYMATDARTLLSFESLQALDKILNLLVHRVPLPDADGLLDEQGTPLPTQKTQASKRVQKANQEAENLTKETVKFLGSTGSADLVEQPKLQEPINVNAISKNVVEG